MKHHSLAACLMLASQLLFAVMPASAQSERPGDEDWVAVPTAEWPRGATPDGDRFYCQERKLGSWFYCERPQREPGPVATGDSAADSAQPGAAARLAAIGTQLEELKARAILDPSEANVAAFIRFQRQQLDRASTFSDQWQRTIWQNPELDYTLQRPVSTLGKRAWIDNRRLEIDRSMASLARRFGIFFFYAQNCAACDVFAPILKALADKHGFSVVAVTMDGGPNRVFRDYVVDVGQHRRMGLTSRATPALVLFDTAQRQPMVIGTGILSADEIQERIFALTETRVGSDF